MKSFSDGCLRVLFSLVNENVHFLNQVDERDLISLMDEDEARELEEQLARQKEEEEVAQAAIFRRT